MQEKPHGLLPLSGIKRHRQTLYCFNNRVIVVDALPSQFLLDDGQDSTHMLLNPQWGLQIPPGRILNFARIDARLPLTSGDAYLVGCRSSCVAAREHGLVD